MVYCVNCGAKNPDEAVTCTQCGRSIMHVERERKWREEEVVFGMPHHWGGVLVGVFIIVIGLVFLFKQFVPMLVDIFWPLVLIFVGAAILLSGLYRYSHQQSNSYETQSSREETANRNLGHSIGCSISVHSTMSEGS